MLGGADTYESLLLHFENFLKMCKRTGITLNPAKVKVRYIKQTRYGMNIEQGKITPTDRNPCPVKRMVAHKNKSKLRSILGVFNQWNNFIPHYMEQGRPSFIINSLMTDNIEFTWIQRHDDVLQELRRIILETDICLYTPDHNHKFILLNHGWMGGNPIPMDRWRKESCQNVVKNMEN